MPKHPNLAGTAGTLSSKVFSSLAAKAKTMRAGGKHIYALSVGDTYLEPIEAAQAQSQRTQTHPGLHKYAPVQGEPVLLDAIATRLAKFGADVPTNRIQVMSGATAGLMVVANALLEPGDEVLLPAPFWPLIRGIISGRGGVPVQVPLFDRLDSVDVEAELEARVTERTVAIYINTPHNPTSHVLPQPAIDAMIAVAKRHNLWVITDEAYQDLWLEEPAEPVWMRPDIADRYIACHTLSKSHGMAGARIGYTHACETAFKALKGVQTFTTYCAPRPMQHAAVAALNEGDEFLELCRSSYAAAGRLAADALGVAHPKGGTFLFFNASAYKEPGEEDSLGFLERCLDRGVLLTPGSSCGQDYKDWVRLCFTSVPLEDLSEALERIRPLIA